MKRMRRRGIEKKEEDDVELKKERKTKIKGKKEFCVK